MSVPGHRSSLAIPLPVRAALAWLAVAVLPACTRPPSTTTPPPLDGAVAPPDCDAPPVAHEPEGCHDDSARPPDGPPAERPGVDGDGDGVEDILDVCPDDPAAPGTDANGDGCADGAGAATS